jgi:uncharacterized membrane protein
VKLCALVPFVAILFKSFATKSLRHKEYTKKKIEIEPLLDFCSARNFTQFKNVNLYMEKEAPNARLEMFCDGVFAIAITLLVLEIKVPPLESIHSIADVWGDIALLWPSFFALALSFTVIFISWMGHHVLLKALDKTSDKFQAVNGIFLFTVIILPFPTAFMAEYLNTASSRFLLFHRPAS